MSAPPSVPPAATPAFPLDDDAILRLDNQLCFAAYSAAHAFNRAYKPLLKALGLTYPQYLVMLVLWENGAATVSEIGNRLFLDSGTLTPLLKRMEAAGLLERRRSDSDERQVVISLTEQGAALKARAVAVPRALLCALGGDANDIGSLRQALSTLRDRLNAAADRL